MPDTAEKTGPNHGSGPFTATMPSGLIAFERCYKTTRFLCLEATGECVNHIDVRAVVDGNQLHALCLKEVNVLHTGDVVPHQSA